MCYVRNAVGPAERCLCDDGIDRRNAHDRVNDDSNNFQQERTHQSGRSGRFGAAVQATSTGVGASPVQDFAEHHRAFRGF